MPAGSACSEVDFGVARSTAADGAPAIRLYPAARRDGCCSDPDRHTDAPRGMLRITRLPKGRLHTVDRIAPHRQLTSLVNLPSDGRRGSPTPYSQNRPNAQDPHASPNSSRILFCRTPGIVSCTSQRAHPMPAAVPAAETPRQQRKIAADRPSRVVPSTPERQATPLLTASP